MVTTVQITNGDIPIAADIRYPDNFDESKKYPVIVIGHPISSCKEQTSGAIYGSQLVKKGYITLAFDASYQGSSGGEPRFVEWAAKRVQDFSTVVDYLVTLPYVDENKIGLIGICGGGGYAANAALTEKRYKAVGLIVPANFGRVIREGDGTPDAALKALDALAAQRTAEARSLANGKDEPLITGYIPFSSQEEREKAGVNDIDIQEAIDYYLTPRAQAKASPNKLRVSTTASGYSFDAFHLAEFLFNQPLHVSIGAIPGGFGSYRDGHDIYYRARTSEKKLQVIPNVSHYDLYDKPEVTGLVVDSLTEFFNKNLA